MNKIWTFARRPTPKALVATALVAIVATACNSGKSTIELGAVLPLSGDYGAYGQSIQNGITLALEEVQADTERRFEFTLDVQDTVGDPARAAEIGTTMFSSKDAVIGGVTSAEALAMIEPLEQSSKILLSPAASSPALSGKSRQFFRIYPNSDQESSAMSNFARDTLKVESIAILAEDTEYGRSGAEAFRKVWQGEVPADLTFAPGASADMVAEVIDSGAQTVYVVARGGDLSGALSSLRGGGFGGQGYRILTTSALASPSVLEAAGDKAYNTYYTQTGVDLAGDKPEVQAFATAYEAKYGAKPDLYAAYGYDSLKVLVAAINEGVKGASPLQGDIQTGFRAVQNLQGVTGAIQFRDTGDVQQFSRVYFVTNEGELVNFDEWYKAQFARELQRKQREELQREKRQASCETPARRRSRSETSTSGSRNRAARLRCAPGMARSAMAGA